MMPLYLYLMILSVASQCIVNAVLQEPPRTRNTIFGDERLEGEIFEDLNLDSFSKDELLNNENNPFRLPSTTKPTHYKVLWELIDLEAMLFTGTVEIDLVATQIDVNEIIIHSHVQIISITLTQDTNNLDIEYEDEPSDSDFLSITTNKTLDFNAQNPIKYTLTISFKDDLNTDMHGIYISWFMNETSHDASWMVATQFGLTSARYAFPCYDEPKFKATFEITIRRSPTYKSWSATRIRETVPGNSELFEYEDDIYHITPLMSTYLLAFIVAKYESENDEGSGLLRHEVIARPAAIELDQGKYAFNVGQELLAKMSEHTNIDYYSVNDNLKLTHAAIPDFSFGAMENWGLITYREAYLMYDEEHTSGHFKQMIASLLGHEIAHMWYGNLVSCDWWDVTWLSEGFARYYQYFLTHMVKEYMGLETRFITEQVHTALLSDSANNPHPLTNPGVGSPAQVLAMFSTISYNKGAAVIKMTEHLLGSNIHTLGLRDYLETNRLGTARPIDLFEALQNAGVEADAFSEYSPNFSFIDYYKSWTEQAGHPVITVKVDHQTGQMFITQGRFNINTGYSDTNTNWIIPITFASASNPDFDNTKPTHIIRDSLTVINRGSIGDQWVIFNKQQTGFYRVNYDEYTWNLIVLALKGEDRTRIHEYNRAQIVDDVFQFARSGLMTYTRALTILSFLEFETAYAPWVAAMSGFSWLRNRLAGTPHLSHIENLIARLATRVMREVTYYPVQGESFMTSYLRYQLAPTMCAINVRGCRNAANGQFRALRDRANIEVPVDNRQFVYCNGLRSGIQDDFTYLWNRYMQHQVYTEKITILQSLGCTRHLLSLTLFLDTIVQDIFAIRAQDFTTAWNSAVTGNEQNTQIVFNYIRNNLGRVYNAFQSYSTPLSYISSRLRTEEEIDEFQQWAYLNQRELGNEFQNIFNGAETARHSIWWAAAIADDLNNYFVNGGDNTIQNGIDASFIEASINIASELVDEPETPKLVAPETPKLVGSDSLKLIEPEARKLVEPDPLE